MYATQLHLLPFILPLPLPPSFPFFPSSSSPVVPLTPPVLVLFIFFFPLSSLPFSSLPLSSLLSFLFIPTLHLPSLLSLSPLLSLSSLLSPLTPPLFFLFTSSLPLSSLLSLLSHLFLSSLLSPSHSSPELASRAPISCIRCHKLRTSDKFKCGRCGDIYLTKAVVTSGEGGGEEAALSQLSAWKRRKEARDSQENNSGAAVTLQGDSEGSGTFVISHSHVSIGTIVACYHTCSLYSPDQMPVVSCPDPTVSQEKVVS